MSDSEVGGVAVFTDDIAALAFGVELFGVGELLFRGATLDPELALLRELEHGWTAIQRIEQRSEFLGRILGS